MAINAGSASVVCWTLQIADIRPHPDFSSAFVGCAPTLSQRKEHIMLRSAVVLAAIFAAVAGPALASGDDRVSLKERYELASDLARCTARPVAEWLSIDQLTQKLKEQGYTVGKVETSHGCYEVKATDAKGLRVELYVDPATAEVVTREGRS
jgi:hypothetical protein